MHTLERQPGLDWRLALNISHFIQQGGFDVVHCHQYTPWFYGWLDSLFTGVRLVFTEHGRCHPDRHRCKVRLVKKIVATTTKALVAISNATREALMEYEFLSNEQIQVIYNGIEPLKLDLGKADEIRIHFGIARDGLVFGTVSRLDPVKNQRMMLKAFSLFRAQHVTGWLLMAGDGPDRLCWRITLPNLGLKIRLCSLDFSQTLANTWAL